MLVSTLLWISVVLLLVAANAFFVATEFALVSIRKTRVEALVASGLTGARALQKLHHRLDEVLNAVQFGITLASLALGWIGEPVVAGVVQVAFRNLPNAAVYAHAIAILLAFALITYLHVILGEVVPKSVALQRTEPVALAVSAPMNVFMVLSRPALYLMSKSAAAALRALRMHPVGELNVHSPEELMLIIGESRRLGLVPPLQEEIIRKTLELEKTRAGEVMVAYRNAVTLPTDTTGRQALSRLAREQRSRVPLYDATLGREHIVGILYAKDLIAHLAHRAEENPTSLPAELLPRQASELMRTPMILPANTKLSNVLREFKRQKRHLAVVVDEFGSTLGLITLADVLEQLLGEIEDEFDSVKESSMALETPRVLEGSINLRDLETEYRIVLPRGRSQTLAGFVLEKLQQIPCPGKQFIHEGLKFTVLEMVGHRIAQVKIERSMTW